MSLRPHVLVGVIFSTALLSATPNVSLAQQPTAVSFRDALTMLMQKNVSVKKASETLESALEQADQADYVYLPEFKATGKSARSGDDAGYRANEHRAGVAANLNLFRFGADQAAKEAAEKSAASASSAHDATTLEAETEAAMALIDLLEAQFELEINQRVAEARKSNLDMARRLYEKGVRPAQDVDKIVIDAANGESRLREAELRLLERSNAIRALAGELVVVESAWPWVEGLRGDRHAAVLEARPDFNARAERKALAERVESLAASAEALRSQMFPALDLAVGYDFVRREAEGLSGDLESANSKEWSGALILTVPLFDRFEARTDYRVRLRDRQIAALDLQAKDQELVGEWETARAGLRAARAAAIASDQTLQSARSLYERGLKSFQAGVLSANELDLEQSRLHETELYSLRSWASAHRYLARLCRSLGRRLSECG